MGAEVYPVCSPYLESAMTRNAGEVYDDYVPEWML